MNTLADTGFVPQTNRSLNGTYDGSGPITAPLGQRIAPRTLAKMRAMDYLQLARQRFLDGTSHRTPIEAVEAGTKSVFDWCVCLAEARSEVGSPSSNDN
jgi:hypothetical protein